MDFVSHFLHAAWPAIITVMGGPVVWFLTEFLARPIRRFFDMKMDAKRLTLRLWDAPEYGRQDSEEWKERMDELKATHSRLAELGDALFAFSQSEQFAVRFIHMFGYDAAAAGLAAKKIAFELGTNIEDREANYRKLDKALKFPFDPNRPFYDPYHPGPLGKPKPKA